MMNALEECSSTTVAADEMHLARCILAPVMQISKCFSLNECKDKFVEIIDAGAGKNKMPSLRILSPFLGLIYCNNVLQRRFRPFRSFSFRITANRSGQRRISTFQCRVHRGNGIQSALEIGEGKNQSGKKNRRASAAIAVARKKIFTRQN